MPWMSDEGRRLGRDVSFRNPGAGTGIVHHPWRREDVPQRLVGAHDNHCLVDWIEFIATSTYETEIYSIAS